MTSGQWLRTWRSRAPFAGLRRRLGLPRIEDLDRSRAEREARDLDEVRAERIGSIPAGRLGKPEELASLAVYLCSEPAAFQTGTFTLVDGSLVRAV